VSRLWARKRELAKEDPRIGKISDERLARSLGVATDTIRKARIELGIPPSYTGTKLSDLAKKDPRLGKVSDTKLARLLGVSHTTLGTARRELGIPA
jgi:hypothetical protein